MRFTQTRRGGDTPGLGRLRLQWELIRYCGLHVFRLEIIFIPHKSSKCDLTRMFWPLKPSVTDGGTTTGLSHVTQNQG